MKRAVFPGSFDPLTLGHCDLIERALSLFDEIIIAIGINVEKTYMFSLEERTHFLTETFAGEPGIRILTYQGLTVSFCKQQNASFIVRGLRNPGDFEFEKAIAHINQKLSGIETVFFLTAPEKSYISSSIIRDVIRNGGDYTSLVPEAVRVKRP
jgi:pantetheine-phosphate adenylyltransferase